MVSEQILAAQEAGRDGGGQPQPADSALTALAMQGGAREDVLQLQSITKAGVRDLFERMYPNGANLRG